MSNLILRVYFRLAGYTSAIKSKESGEPFSIGRKVLTIQLPFMWTPVQLGMHLSSK